MAFNPQGTDYRGAQASRDRADEGLTRALDRKGRADKQARIKKSGERSGLQKLLSAGVRGAAAFYTGGASEAMGFGGAIDSAMLGTDSEGNAVRNEYGELVGAASQIGTAMSAKKAGEAAQKLKMQQTADAAMQARLDKLDPRLGMDYALKLQEKDKRNLDALQKHEGGFTGLLNEDVEGLDLESTTVGDWGSAVKKKAPAPKQIDYSDGGAIGPEGQTFMPESPKTVAPKPPPVEVPPVEKEEIKTQANIIDEMIEKRRKEREELKNIPQTFSRVR